MLRKKGLDFCVDIICNSVALCEFDHGYIEYVYGIELKLTFCSDYGGNENDKIAIKRKVFRVE